MADIKGYDIPDELYYHEEHCWARVDGTKVTVGMTDFFQKEAGDIVFVDLPEEEDDVSQGEVCGKIQSRKWIGKMVAPVSGEIIEINEELEEQAQRLEEQKLDIQKKNAELETARKQVEEKAHDQIGRAHV